MPVLSAPAIGFGVPVSASASSFISCSAIAAARCLASFGGKPAAINSCVSSSARLVGIVSFGISPASCSCFFARASSSLATWFWAIPTASSNGTPLSSSCDTSSSTRLSRAVGGASTSCPGTTPPRGPRSVEAAFALRSGVKNPRLRAMSSASPSVLVSCT